MVPRLTSVSGPPVCAPPASERSQVVDRRPRPRMAASLSGIFLAVAAIAAPRPVEASPQQGFAAAKAEMERLQGQSDLLVDAYNANQEKLARLGRRVDAGNARLAELRAQVAAAKAKLNRQAVVAYKYGADGGVSMLMSLRRPNEFPAAAKYLEQLQSGTRQAMDGVKAAREDLDVEVRALDAARADQRKVVSSIKADQRRIEAGIARQEAIATRYAQEIAAERARVEAAMRARLAVTGGGGVGAAAPRGRRGRGRGRVQVGDAGVVSGSGGGAAAVEYAKRMIGTPYRWGAAGGGGFDCSGLTMAAWGAGGRRLPHNSSAQIGSMRSVNMSELQPGDILWRPGHVAIYVGNGVAINSPHSGASVGYTDAGRFTRAGRP